jgi:hypothetical protein
MDNSISVIFIGVKRSLPSVEEKIVKESASLCTNDGSNDGAPEPILTEKR